MSLTGERPDASVPTAPAPIAAPRRQGKAVNRRGRAGEPTRPSAPPIAAPPVRAGGPRAKLRYWFDTGLSRGPSVVIGWLGLLTVLVIAVTALVMTLFGLIGVNGGERLGFGESLWQSMLRVVDAGTFAGDSSWPTRLLGLAITLAGIFLAGSLIGLIANLVDQRVESLRKGRSAVLESGHTLILGWSSRVPTIVSELVLANESERRAVVVILADEDKSVMEDTLRDHIGDLRTTRLVCRRGNGDLPADLDLVNVRGARSVVVVGDEDATVVKTLLAVRSIDPDFVQAHVVAEVASASTDASIRALFGPRVVTVNSDRIVAELTAQACRQRGLSTVFRELLDFDGDEVYFAPFDEVTGHTYGEAQLAFESSSLMGRLTADGAVELNPPADTVLQPGDELIAIASDDSTFVLDGFRAAPVVAPPVAVAVDGGPRRILVIGWSDLGPRVLAELDEFLELGTVIEVIADPAQVDVAAIPDSVTTRNVLFQVESFAGGPETITAHASRSHFDEVIVLGYREHLTTEESDARTLLTLMAFNQMVEREGLGDVRIVAELLDQRHTPLAQATGADDFIVSDELTSLLIAQLSERHELDLVFRDLFDQEGCAIELRPAVAYGADRAGSYAEIVAAASLQDHTALGYRLAASGEVVINPAKSAATALSATDEVLVLR